MPRRLRSLFVAVTVLLILLFAGIWLLNNNPLSTGPSDANPANRISSTQGMTEITRRPVPTLAVIDLPPVDVGRPSTKDGIAITILGVTTQKSLGDFTPGTGNAYLVADVKIENAKADPIQFSNLYFAVTASNGETYRPAHSSSDFAPKPALIPGNLPKGASVRGNVVFEVPTSLTSGMIKYVNEQANAEIWYQYQFAWK
jgi:hypothetical protein